MSIQLALQGIETAAVLAGVIFAVVQVRQLRRDRRRAAAIELLHSFQTPVFAEALNIVYNLPDGLSREALEQRLDGRFPVLYSLMTTWEPSQYTTPVVARVSSSWSATVGSSSMTSRSPGMVMVQPAG